MSSSMWNGDVHKKKAPLNRGILIATGVTLIVLSLVVFGVSLVESYRNIQENYHVVTIPGFHDLELNSRGTYVGVYQQSGEKSLPIQALSQMDIRLFFKDDYQEIPVTMNKAGGGYKRFGQEGMLLFSFVINHPGPYALSGFYLGEGEAPTLPISLFAQAAQSIRQTLVVGAVFFILFLVLGIIVLVKAGKTAKKDKLPS